MPVCPHVNRVTQQVCGRIGKHNTPDGCFCGYHNPNKVRKERPRKMQGIVYEPAECSICLNPIMKRDCHVTKCNHTFHKKCLTRWEIEKNNCPMCRCDLSSELMPIARKVRDYITIANEMDDRVRVIMDSLTITS